MHLSELAWVPIDPLAFKTATHCKKLFGTNLFIGSRFQILNMQWFETWIRRDFEPGPVF